MDTNETCTVNVNNCPYVQAKRRWLSHPGAVLIFLIAQFATILWWASGITTRVEKLEGAQQGIGERFDRFSDHIDQKLDRIDQRLVEHEQRTSAMFTGHAR